MEGDACLHAEREGLLGQEGDLRGGDHLTGALALIPIVWAQIPAQHYPRISHASQPCVCEFCSRRLASPHADSETAAQVRANS